MLTNILQHSALSACNQLYSAIIFGKGLASKPVWRINLHFSGTVCTRMCSVVPDAENHSNWIPQSCKNLTLRQTIKMRVALSVCPRWFLLGFYNYRLLCLVLSAQEFASSDEMTFCRALKSLGGRKNLLLPCQKLTHPCFPKRCTPAIINFKGCNVCWPPPCKWCHKFTFVRIHSDFETENKKKWFLPALYFLNEFLEPL